MTELKPIPFFYGNFYVIEKTPKELGERTRRKTSQKTDKIDMEQKELV